MQLFVNAIIVEVYFADTICLKHKNNNNKKTHKIDVTNLQFIRKQFAKKQQRF